MAGTAFILSCGLKGSQKDIGSCRGSVSVTHEGHESVAGARISNEGKMCTQRADGQMIVQREVKER